MSLLKCENLSFAYDGVTVVSNLNFSVEEGNYLCIIGENGAGKSTLIKGLLRLKKPSAGRVEMGEGLKATEIGYLPQQTQIQKDFPASVREVVLSGCLNRMGLRPFYSRVEKERAHEKMEALEILDLQDQCYRDLSGGQQQRVLLARAMCAAHKLILLDEPVSGLDPVATRSLYAQIARINETTGLTVIMVSHDIDASCFSAHRRSICAAPSIMNSSEIARLPCGNTISPTASAIPPPARRRSPPRPRDRSESNPEKNLPDGSDSGRRLPRRQKRKRKLQRKLPRQ